MNSQLSPQLRVVGRRIRVTRRPGRHEQFPDTSLTDSWPPRLNTAL